MSLTLKELLKPPFWMDEDGVVRSHIPDSAEHRLICIPVLPKNNPEILTFILEAFTEKAAREWGERKRWVEYYEGGILFSECPNCKIKRAKNKTAYLYCPICGERLDPPEGSDG